MMADGNIAFVEGCSENLHPSFETIECSLCRTKRSGVRLDLLVNACSMIARQQVARAKMPNWIAETLDCKRDRLNGHAQTDA